MSVGTSDRFVNESDLDTTLRNMATSWRQRSVAAEDRIRQAGASFTWDAYQSGFAEALNGPRREQLLGSVREHAAQARFYAAKAAAAGNGLLLLPGSGSTQLDHAFARENGRLVKAAMDSGRVVYSNVGDWAGFEAVQAGLI